MPGPLARTGLPQTTGPSALSPTLRRSSTAVIGIPGWYGADRPAGRASSQPRGDELGCPAGSPRDDGSERVRERPDGRRGEARHVDPAAADHVDGMLLAEARHLLEAEPEEREHPPLRRDRGPVARDPAPRDRLDERRPICLDPGPHPGELDLPLGT